MRILYFLFVLLIPFSLFGQQERVTLDWGNDAQSKRSQKEILNPKHFTFSEDTGWSYTAQWEVSATIQESSVRLENVVFGNVSRELEQSLSKVSLPAQPQFQLVSRKGRDKGYAILELNPFVLNNGRLQRIISFDVKYAFAKTATSTSRLPLPIRC